MNLELLTAKYPSERQALHRLADLLKGEKNAEYTLNRISDLVEPNSKEALAGALGELVRTGEMNVVIKVISPSSQGSIKEFKSLHEVPPVIHDWRSDRDMEVTPESLRVVYVTRSGDK